jgi:DNA-binding NarL/FixJ family response regulator
VPSRDPTPSQVVRAKERWDQILAPLSESQQQIVGLLLEGHTHREIAEKLGLNERTIRRVLQKVTPVSWIHGGRPVNPVPDAALDKAGN